MMRPAAFVFNSQAAAAIAAEGKPAATKAAPAKGPRRYRWEQVENKSLALVGPCGIVWQLNFAAGLTKPYFHPLQTADGSCLTQIAPPDHHWHYGLWHAWKFIDRVNYWEEDQPGGRSAGVTRIAKREIVRLDDTGAHVRLTLEYFPRDKNEVVVMDDVIGLTIELPRDDDGSYRIGWEQTSRARRPLRLDRTPPPGAPDGKDYGGYAGLSFRGDRFLTEVELHNANGQSGAAAQRQPARWAAMVGRVDGQSASLAMFDHPENPRHPTPWYFVLRQSRGGAPFSPFWYLNAAFLNDAPFDLTPEHPLTLRYLVRIDTAPPPADVLDAEFARYAATGKIPNPASP